MLSWRNHSGSIQRKLSTLLARVDATLVTRKQKIRLYKIGVCLCIHAQVCVSVQSWIEKTLDPLVKRYLK